jgi:hypothetical protein
MITFRYHLVSIAAVLLALAAGVALGAGALDGRFAPDREQGSSSGGDSALVSFENGYAARTSTGLIEGTLDDRSVVLLTLPGADAEQVAGVRRNLERAGATITGTVALTSKLVDPANRQFAESVTEEAAPDSPGEGYARVGAALGRSLLGRAGRELDQTARTTASAFEEGGLTSASAAPERFAGQAVVVAGPSRLGDSAEVVTGLLRALAGTSDGTLLAGPSASSLDGGAVDVVRREASQVSTVDVTDSAAGRAVTALALARVAAGETGAWGTSRSEDGSVPR